MTRAKKASSRVRVPFLFLGFWPLPSSRAGEFHREIIRNPAEIIRWSRTPWGLCKDHAGMIGVNNQSFTPFSRRLPSSSFSPFFTWVLCDLYLKSTGVCACNDMSSCPAKGNPCKLVQKQGLVCSFQTRSWT